MHVIVYINSDGSNQTVEADNDPAPELETGFVQDVGLDTAAGFFFAARQQRQFRRRGAPGPRHDRRRRPGDGGRRLPRRRQDQATANFDDIIVNALHVDNDQREDLRQLPGSVRRRLEHRHPPVRLRPADRRRRSTRASSSAPTSRPTRRSIRTISASTCSTSRDFELDLVQQHALLRGTASPAACRSRASTGWTSPPRSSPRW